MSRKSIFPDITASALLVAILLPGMSWARGTFNSRQSFYQEDLKDIADLVTVQALTFNTGGFMEVAGSWTWYSPGQPSGNILGNSTKFSATGSATQFTTVGSGGTYGEKISLMSHWFSAASDMIWSSNSNCASGDAGLKCIVKPVLAFPIEAGFGARSDSVLKVISVDKYRACDGIPVCKPTDFIVATLTLQQRFWSDLFVPGYPYSATFYLRYPGAGGPPVAPKSVLVKLIAYFDTGLKEEYMGGATAGCDDNTKNEGCQQRKNYGCPWLLVTDTPGRGQQDFYLGDVYNPFTFSFCAGANKSYDPLPSNDWPPECYRCNDPLAINYAACLDPIEGTWVFQVKADHGAAVCDTASCGNATFEPDVPLLYDGIQITAGGVRISNTMAIMSTVHEDSGSYVSPVFDSLSPNTQWGNIAWEVEQNRDSAAWARTPVRLKWRAGATPDPGVLPYWIAAGGDHYAAMVPFTSSGEGMPDAGSTTLYAGPVVSTGQYFQYEANLTSWSENMLNRPSRRIAGDFKSCVRYKINYDGTLMPEVRQVAVSYTPDAGQIISKTITPNKLRAWKAVRYEKDDGGGAVAVDILDSDNNVIMAGIASGEPLNGLDPGRYPSIRIKVTLKKNGVGGAVPKIKWFKVDYEPQEDLLSINQNSLRLARNDEIHVRVFVEKTGIVEIRVYDAAGQLVKGVFRGEVKGSQMLQVAWNGRDTRGGSVAPGVYFVTAITPSGRQTGRVAVAR